MNWSRYRPAQVSEGLLVDVARRASAYRAGLSARNVFPSEEALQKIHRYDEPLPQTGLSSCDVISELDALAADATVASAGPRYLGFVTGSSFPAALAANWLATAWDQNVGAVAMSPALAQIEAVAARWTQEALAFPQVAVGFVTGSTMANTTAMLAARRALLLRQGWDVERQGLRQSPEIRIVAGADAHASLVHGIGMIGLGIDNIVRVPVDTEGRIKVDQMPALDDATILCVQAGNVNSGAFDDLERCAELAAAAGAWLHVDSAFGLWARVCPDLAHLVQGIDRADSWSTSAHKILNVPYDSAIVMCRDGSALEGAMSVSHSYMVRGNDREPNHFTPEGSRRARGVDIWAMFKQLGREGLSAHVKNCHENAKAFGEMLQQEGVTVLNDVCFNQVLLDLGELEQRDLVLAGIAADGKTWLGPTTWHGRPAARASFCSWSTTREDVAIMAESVIENVCRVQAQTE